MRFILECGLLLLTLLIGISSARNFSSRANFIPGRHQPFQMFIVTAPKYEFGAGVSITNRHVLTTATMIRGSNVWNVGYGSNELHKLQFVESTAAFIHPNFNEAKIDNNLGIIVLPTILPSIVKQIALPPTDVVLPRVNEEGTVVGFGLTESTPKEIAPNKQLKTVYLMAMSNSVCSTALPGVNTANNFCARDDQPDSMNICQGDSGSAYVIVHRGQQFLGGLSSVVSNSCTPTETTAFVRIQSYVKWIQDLTR